jgi:diacylglycerol kinase
MEFSHPEIVLQVRPLTLRENRRGSALKKIFANDPAIVAQFFLVAPIIAAGIAFHISALQWFLILLATGIFLVCGIFRAAAILQTKRDSTLSSFHVSRIKIMGNALMVISAGISFLTYLLIFIPAILKSF